MAKENTSRVRYGTSDGELKFGSLTADNEISAVSIRNFASPLHYIALSKTGGSFRKNGTICRSTGAFQVRAGDDINDEEDFTFETGNPDLTPTLIDESEYRTSDQPGIYLEAVSGDVVIRAPSGKVRIEGQVGIELVCQGYDNDTGNIILDANEKVIINGQQVQVEGKSAVAIISSDRFDLISKTTLNMYSLKIDICDAVLTKNPFSTLVGVVKGTTTKFEAQMTLKNFGLSSFI